MILSVGSKVFLMGEYLALNGGPAMLASLEPRFQMRIQKKIESVGSSIVNIAPQSPAGIFYQKNQKFFSDYNIEFIDPHNGAGGWGASSAQYAMLAAFLYGQATIQTDAQWDLDLQQIDKEYLRITSQNTAGLPPSGMDVIAQLRGGLVLINRNKGHIENMVWPFNDVSFLLFSTGVKVPTHTHLSSLISLPMLELNECAHEFNSAFSQINSEHLAESINNFRETLLQNHLEVQTTTEWIKKIKPIPGVLATKGCGALGADVIMLLVEKSAQNNIIQALKLLGVNSVVTKEQLTGPLHVSFDSKSRQPNIEASK